MRTPLWDLHRFDLGLRSVSLQKCGSWHDMAGDPELNGCVALSYHNRLRTSRKDSGIDREAASLLGSVCHYGEGLGTRIIYCIALQRPLLRIPFTASRLPYTIMIYQCSLRQEDKAAHANSTYRQTICSTKNDPETWIPDERLQQEEELVLSSQGATEIDDAVRPSSIPWVPTWLECSETLAHIALVLYALARAATTVVEDPLVFRILELGL